MGILVCPPDGFLRLWASCSEEDPRESAKQPEMSGGAVRINSILVERHSNADAVARRAAELVGETLEAKPDAVLLLPAGGTPVPMYAELRRLHESGDLDFSRSHGFQLDEIVGVKPEDPRSFHAFLQNHFFQSDAEAIQATAHLIDGTAEDPSGEIDTFQVDFRLPMHLEPEDLEEDDLHEDWVEDLLHQH